MPELTGRFGRRIIRFAASGLLATTLHVLLVVLQVESGQLQPATANGIAFAITTVASYFINTIWSFSVRPDRATFLRFSVVALLGMLLASALAGLVDSGAFHYGYGILLVVSIVPPLTFLAHCFWTYA